MKSPKTDYGWIKLHRKIQDTQGYFSEEFCKNMAWVDLLILANHAEDYYFVRGVKVTVKRGQVGHSAETLAKRWKWSRGKVKRFLDLLQSQEQIVVNKDNVMTLITILKYEQYQGDGEQKERTTPAIKKEVPLSYVPTDIEKQWFDSFNKWVVNNAANVSKMKEPFTIEQFLKAKKEFGGQALTDMLAKMHNYKPLVEKNVSAYLTFCNWMKRDAKKQNQVTQNRLVI
jgi:hypothetical protein